MRGPTIYQRRGSAIWQYNFRIGTRRYRGTTGHAEAGAARAEAQRIYEQAGQTGEFSKDVRDPGRGHPHLTFQRHIEDVRRLGRNAATWGNYTRYAEKYLRHFGARPLASLTRRDVEGWRDWLMSQEREDDARNNAARGDGKRRTPSHAMKSAGKNRKYSPKYVSEHLNWLGAVFNHFGLLNVTAKVVRPRATEEEQQRRLKYFTREEMEKMFGACGDEFRNCFVFMAYTGVRNGEMHGLVRRDEDINSDEQIVWVTGKGRKRRALTLRGPAQAAWDGVVGEIRRREVETGETVFEPYERWADKRLRALCRAVGIAERGPHALRHTFATHALLFWGWDISVLAKWLGHESIDVTYRIYGHLIPATPPRMWGWEVPQCDQDKSSDVNCVG